MLYLNLGETYMSVKKGFTLIEIIVALVILAILAAVALPNYMTMMTQGAANAAQNNLIAIYNAQKTYYFANAAYCTSTNSVCNSLASINSTLSLNITDARFTYTCNSTNGFTCTATNISDGNLSLAVTNTPIILPGGAGCASPWSAPCNPSCATDVAAYCPSSSF
jgi:type IV pilus assembly protein PilE